MMRKSIILLSAMLLPAAVTAETWTEKCPQMEVGKVFTYKRIWHPDNTWSKRTMPSNQPQLMSCGNWKVFEQSREMVCYYGGYKVTYDYAVKKPIPDGTTCVRDTTCQFKCTKKPAPQQKMSPSDKLKRKLFDRLK